ncbi:hypothetical protein QFC20_007718 [Naganishia adeliensis]|uniref:Uncharacterized protein n=1 Tax=Naganishia adeliensis TaxID=92952 RepID=A0ACC2UW80_9TREE|nr:hypothetical protein QFC20_007718 [Naganishia adeliensis]
MAEKRRKQLFDILVTAQCIVLCDSELRIDLSNSHLARHHEQEKGAKSIRNSNGTFGSTKKTVELPFAVPAPPSIAPESVSESPPPEHLNEEAETVVFFDDPEDHAYIFDEKDLDAEDRSKVLRAPEQQERLDKEWKASAKKRRRREAKDCSKNHTYSLDHEDNPAPKPESTNIATLHDGNDDDTMLNALKSAIGQSSLQRHEGSDAAGGGEELELEPEMQELAEGGNEAKDAEKDGEEEEDEQEDVQEEHGDMHKASDDPLVIEEDRAALDAYARNSYFNDAIALAVDELAIDNAITSDTVPVLLTIPEAVALSNDTVDKGKRKGATLHVAETAPLMILRNFFIL